jgi:uncharacterized membrane protein
MAGKRTPTQRRGCNLKELIMMGFGEKHRALEVLPQLQRLQFDWSADLQSAVAVEVEKDGRLRLMQSELLDPAAATEGIPHWKAILSAMVPMPHIPASSTAELSAEVRTTNSEGSAWLKDSSLDQDFVRNAAALLRPGNPAILAAVGEWPSALKVLSGFSRIILHTAIMPAENSPKR